MIDQSRIARIALILGLLLFAFALRLHEVTSVPLSHDEIMTISKYVSLSIVDIIETRHSNNQPMASILAHIFSPRADHLFLMRWPMILIGMLALPFVYRLGTSLFGQKVGILTIFLLAISPVHLAYSVVVRGYGGLILLTTISLYCLGRALQYNRWREWLGFVAVNVLITYFHMFGVLAAATQLGLVGIWLLWEFSNRKQRGLLFSGQQLKPKLIKFGIVMLSLLVIYPLLMYNQTMSVFSEGGNAGEFEIWREKISWPQDLSPFVTLLNLMAPMSPGGIGVYIYLIFGTIGLISLWYQQQLLVIGAVIWFFTPFVAVFVAMQILGIAFYTYARFLLYLLPAFLVLVAAGIVASAGWLLTLTEGRSWQWQVPARVVKWVSLAGLFGLALVSTNWYILRSTHSDWLGVGNALLHELQPQDITICEEHQRGFEIPDRAKPYCIWMLEFFVPELKGYTPRFQSSTDFIANYDHLQEQRVAMLQPGGVWLVIWQKIEYNPGHLVTDKRPFIVSSPPISAFAPYYARHFGTATLVHIDSEETLFGNVYKTLELLLQVERSPEDKARYYRSLAEMETVQGHKRQAREFLEKSRAMVEQAGGQYAGLFLADTQPLIDRIPGDRLPGEQAFQAGYRFGPSLCLQAYEVAPEILEADRSLILTLYWQTLDFINEDYDFYLRLDDEAGQTYAWLPFEPFDRIYPTPWWWANQQLVEQREFHLPIDLAGQDYVVHLGAYDRQTSNSGALRPVFLMLLQSGEVEAARWRIKPVAHPTVDCP